MKLKLQGRYSLTMVSLIIAIVLILAGTLLFQFKSSIDELTVASSDTMASDLLRQVKKRAEVTIRFLTENLANPLYHYDMLAMHQLLATTKAQEDVLYTYVYDEKGKIVHDGNVTIPAFGKLLDDDASRRAIVNEGQLLIQVNDDLLGVSLPLWIGDEPLGGVKIGLSLKNITRDIARMKNQLDAIEQHGLRRNVIFLTATTLMLILLGILMSLLIANHLIRPIRQLANYAGQIGRGNYDVQLTSKSQDEIGYLIEAFNQMSHDLQRTTVSKEHFESIIGNMSDSLTVLTPDGQIDMVNSAVCDLLNYGEKELIGQSFETLFPSHALPEIRRWFAAVIEEGSRTYTDTIYLTKDGKEIPISLSGSIIYRTKNNIKGLICVAQDVTERKRMEKALRKSHEELSIKVKEATSELVRSNEQLRQEVEERQKAEELIKTSLKEKEVLLREVYHRVKNNMQVVSSLLKLQSRYVKNNKEMLAVFTESQSRIKSISLIHEKLYESKDLANIDFNGYVKTLARSLFDFYHTDSAPIAMKTEVDNVSLNIDTAIPCGLIINELVSNSLKYAYPNGTGGELKIGIRSNNGDETQLIVSDNGVGLPPDLDFRNTKTLGLQLVISLAEEQLGGKIELDRTTGTKFIIEFGR
jgi:PAS domain S-box-containing protein